MTFELRQKLASVARRIRSLRLWSGLALCWLAWAVVGIVLYWLANFFEWDTATLWPKVAALAVATAIGWVIAASRSARDQRAVARRVETDHPELATLLLAAVDVASLPRVPGKGPSYLQATVMRQALEHGRNHDWSQAVSGRKLLGAKLAQFAALGFLISVCLVLAGRGGALAGSGATSTAISGLPRGDFEVSVEPGNVEIERGTSLLVVAEFARAVPADATLVISAADGADVASEGAEKVEGVSMVRSLDDPKFVGRLPAVDSELRYRVEFSGRRSDTYHVKVFDYPELVRADAQLEYPEYASLPSKTLEDVRHITAVEGTRLELVCRLNKDVAEAKLIDAAGEEVNLRQDATTKSVYRANWTLHKSQRFKLRLSDRDGRGSRLPAEIAIDVTPNRPPKIVLERPGRDVDVSPLEEFQVKANAVDDFGIERFGLSLALGGEEPREIVPAAAGNEAAALQPPAKKRDLDQVIDFESLGVKPDQVVSYFVWAEDYGPDGRLRRTMSDMYFAEVRPFEEIYRQGEQPSENERRQSEQQGGGAGQEAGELADAQKEIINATWKLIRRETAAVPSSEFAVDVDTIQQSQQSLIDRLAELAERVDDSESRAHVAAADRFMREALKHQSASTEGPAVAPLRPALGAEQSAYQALLKLRSREFQVVRGNRQQGGQTAGRNNRSQRQLQQLELSNEENRYETRRSATSPEASAQRESREILNRLKDLARRQEELNERLRELQSALQTAENAGRREELERELKRLRDQQREILRDTDDLIGRMDGAQNREAAQDAQQQMQDGRSHVQQASDALEQGQISQAVTEGTRAGRQLNEVRDQYRQQAANRFSDEMTEMRRDARELDERQQQLSQRLAERDSEQGRSLRGSDPRGSAQEGLAEQRRDLKELQDRMQQTIEESEPAEPLLARQLYDTLRETHQQRVDDALNVTQRLLEVGIAAEAGRTMQTAGQGIRNLRQGVERAAESVLGDEAEALRRAQNEVDQLAEELRREIEQARGDNATDASDGARNSSQQENTRQNGAVWGGEAASREDGDAGGNNPPQEGERGPREDQPRRGEPGPPGANQEQGVQDRASREQDGQRQGGRGQPQPDQNRTGGAEGDEPGNGREGGLGEDREQRSLRGGASGGDGNQRAGIERLLDSGGRGGPGGPITGDDFRRWSERIGDVEEMLDSPDLRSEAARIRDRARDARNDYKRHARMPDWTKLQELVAEPLNELSRRIGEEIRRRKSPDSLVPIDRDPVPPEFSDSVRRYYERLGSGE